MNAKFVAKCKRELVRNNHKGDWDKYKPTRKQLIQEISWHNAKLHAAVLGDGTTEEIMELAADIANLCEKAFDMAQSHKETTVPVRDYYGDLIGYEGDWK